MINTIIFIFGAFAVCFALCQIISGFFRRIQELKEQEYQRRNEMIQAAAEELEQKTDTTVDIYSNFQKS